MMSFALMGCLIIGASDASAQGRSRSQGGSTNRSQSAAVSRSDNTKAPTVSRSSQAENRKSSATPQVNRTTSNSHSGTAVRPEKTTTTNNSGARTGSAVTRGGDNGHSSTTGPRADKSTPKSNSGNATVRDNGNKGTRPGGNGSGGHGGSGNVRPDGNGNHGGNGGNGGSGNVRPDGNGNHGGKGGNGNVRPDGNGNHGGNGGSGNVRPDGNGNHGGNGGNGNVRPDGNGNHGNHGGNGNVRPDGNGNHGGNGGHGNNNTYNPDHRYDYSNHPHRDQFSWNYSHHNWSRPLPPPARAYRPAPLVWSRPVIPMGWRPYAGAPIIDRILGIMFGSYYDVSLDYLYNSGYYIDGYADGIIYLRDVSLLDLYWPDVMLNYEFNKLVNAQFVYHSNSYSRVRYDRVYRSLCRIYGTPVYYDNTTASWYGGNNTGWVTLSLTGNYGDYYTTMSIGY